MELRFIGISGETDIAELINSKFPELRNHFHIMHPKFGKDLLNSLQESNLLLLFNMYSIIGTKIYNYIAAKRQILQCFKEDKLGEKLKGEYWKRDWMDLSLASKMILYIKAGVVVKDKPHLYACIHKFYMEHKEKGFVNCNVGNINDYSREELSKKFAGRILNFLN